MIKTAAEPTGTNPEDMTTASRANRERRRGAGPLRSPFNGGPDSCPAKRAPAGPGQRLRDPPSMEGRTAVRPNWPPVQVAPRIGRFLQWRAGQLSGQTSVSVRPSALNSGSFNGGPDSCPAKPRHAVTRAGHPPSVSFNGGPGQLSGQTARWATHAIPTSLQPPSMEGRTAVRPNPHS